MRTLFERLVPLHQWALERSLSRAPAHGLKHSASNGNLIRIKAEQARRIAANIAKLPELLDKPESASGETRGRGGLGALMRGPISEAVIIVILGFLMGGIPAAVVHFMIDSKWPSPAVSLSRDPSASKAPLTSQ